MDLSRLSLIGLIGTLVFLAGAHLLWEGRNAAIAWLREFIRLLRADVARKTHGQREAAATELRSAPRPRSGALILVGAVALILLGQILFILDLTH